jgi:hypothetical protein
MSSRQSLFKIVTPIFSQLDTTVSEEHAASLFRVEVCKLKGFEGGDHSDPLERKEMQKPIRANSNDEYKNGPSHVILIYPDSPTYT